MHTKQVRQAVSWTHADIRLLCYNNTVFLVDYLNKLLIVPQVDSSVAVG